MSNKEIILASEEVQRRNIITIQNYSKATRKIVRDLEDKIKIMNDMIIEQNKIIAQMRQQLSIVQGILYRGGTVVDNNN